MLRAVMMFMCVGHGVHAEEAATDTVKRDQFGCAVQERPEELTFSMFRDAWRSVAADKLYSFLRHRAVIDGENCDCDTMRPDWSAITHDFEQLGFDDGPRSGYDTWARIEYFPTITALRDAVARQCGDAK